MPPKQPRRIGTGERGATNGGVSSRASLGPNPGTIKNQAIAQPEQWAKTGERQMATTVNLNPISRESAVLTIRGVTPLIQHKWSDKALRQMREKGEGRKTKAREARDPQGEMEAATYLTVGGDYGIPVTALKSAMIAAAHKDLGIEKTMVRKALFIRCNDDNGVLEMTCSDPVMREDCVRVGAGAADLRYRPEFREWGLSFEVEYDAELLRIDDIVNLVNRAGFGVGLNEWRPEKGGEYGRFEVV